MKIVIVLLCVVVACVATENSKYVAIHQPFIECLIKAAKDKEGKNVSVNINDYLDQLLQGMRLWIVKNGLDPLRMEDIEESFSIKIASITWHGELFLTNGWLQGFTSVARKGDAFMDYERKLLNLQLPIHFDILNINYDYLAKIMNIGPSGGVEGKIKNMNLFVNVIVDTTTLEITLQKFDITDTGKITIHFSGNPLVDWLTNALTDLAARLLHNKVVDVIEIQVKQILEEAIDKINDQLQKVY